MQSLPALDELARKARTSGLFFDFDGTLSEIVQSPTDAQPVPGARELLASLSRRYALVSIVSGRSAQQLLERLGPDIEIWGVHGAERTVEGRVVPSPEALPYVALMAEVKAAAQEEIARIGIPGILLEDKGVMLGLHFRAADDVELAARSLDGVAADLAARFGLNRAGSRLAYELRPPVEFSKGEIVLRGVREAALEGALYVGDDTVDLPAFDALDELQIEGISTVRIAVASDEAPAELLDRADLIVQGPTGVLELMKDLDSKAQ